MVCRVFGLDGLSTEDRKQKVQYLLEDDRFECPESGYEVMFVPTTKKGVITSFPDEKYALPDGCNTYIYVRVLVAPIAVSMEERSCRIFGSDYWPKSMPRGDSPPVHPKDVRRDWRVD